MGQRPRRFKTVAITITQGQIEYIDSQTHGLRDKSRWIRDAISMRMLAEASAQVEFSNKYRSEALKDALEVAQNTILSKQPARNIAGAKPAPNSNPRTSVEG